MSLANKLWHNPVESNDFNKRSNTYQTERNDQYTYVLILFRTDTPFKKPLQTAFNREIQKPNKMLV